MYLFELASHHMNWLADRQSVTATNVANANTPGYRAMDVAGFDAALNRTGIQLATTSPGHLNMTSEPLSAAELVSGRLWDSSRTGNTVAIENELINASETSRMMSLDTGLTRTFHRMILSSLKG